MNTVYDTSVVAYSNGQLTGRRKGNALDRRLRVLEEFITGIRMAWYNSALLLEYRQHITTHRNDVIEAFVAQLADRGLKGKKSRLSRQDYARSREAKWPSHDQHLLAAALESAGATIFVTEKVLVNCAGSVRRIFGVRVIGV